MDKNIGGKVITEKKSVNKKAIIVVIAVTLVAIIAGITVLSLYLGGAFEKDVATLYKKNAKTPGFYKYYIDGGELPGTYATMTFEYKGEEFSVDIYLLKDLAPITVNNFIAYADSGFYDNTVIHRIVTSTFTFQGGGYTYYEGGYKVKTATRDPIVGEFVNNGDKYSYNNISHFAGSISTARTSVKDSATSQWFISYEDYTGWDGDYAAFGFIVNGEGVQKIKEIAIGAEMGTNGYPKDVITLKKVTIEERK